MIEIKSSQTIAAPFFKNLKAVSEMIGSRVKSQFLIYGGPAAQERSKVKILPYWQTASIVHRSAASK